jgi:hypothetical protein
MWYVNNVLCYDEKRRDEMKSFYFTQGQAATVREVEKDDHGRWILPLNDPMEQ